MAGIPGIKKLKFYEKKWIVECFAIVPPIILASVTAWINFQDPNKSGQAWLLVIGIIWLVGASIVKVMNAYKQDAEQKQKQDYDGLLGTLHVLYGSLSRHLNFGEKDYSRLRATVHRVVPHTKANQASEQLEQLLPYVGGKGKEPGRKFSIRSGIIGKAVREKAPFAFSRQNDDHEAFIKELVSDWSYTEEDARSLTADRKSWMAVPIFGKDDSVVGVVYLDSNEKNFFNKDVQTLVINTCSGIASYITERYK